MILPVDKSRVWRAGKESGDTVRNCDTSRAGTRMRSAVMFWAMADVERERKGWKVKKTRGCAKETCSTKGSWKIERECRDEEGHSAMAAIVGSKYAPFRK